MTFAQVGGGGGWRRRAGGGCADQSERRRVGWWWVIRCTQWRDRFERQSATGGSVGSVFAQSPHAKCSAHDRRLLQAL
jgi:hypothetical protein